MKVLFFVLKQSYMLDDVIHSLSQSGIKHATLFNSTSMYEITSDHTDHNELDFLNAAKSFLRPSFGKADTCTIMSLMEDDEIQVAVKAIESVTGNLDDKQHGILFTMPVDFSKGSIPYGK